MPIIQLLMEQHLERNDIAETLFNCETGWWENEHKVYIYFVISKNPNTPGDVWQISDSFVLYASNGKDWIILDI